MASTALGLVGTVVGTYFGGPVGGAFGGALGSLAGTAIDNALFPADKLAPNLDNLYTLRADYGTSIPRIWGSMRVAGSYIWVQPLEHQDGDSGSKGKGASASSSSAAPYDYFLHAAVLIADARNGPIRVVQVLADSKIIYDARQVLDKRTVVQDTALGYEGFGGNTGGSQITGTAQDPNYTVPTQAEIDSIASVFDNGIGNYSDYMTFYDGTQVVADSHIESFDGAGNVPAYTGTAYMVLNRLPLKNFLDHPPKFEFVVEIEGCNYAPLVENAGSVAGTGSSRTAHTILAGGSTLAVAGVEDGHFVCRRYDTATTELSSLSIGPAVESGMDGGSLSCISPDGAWAAVLSRSLDTDSTTSGGFHLAVYNFASELWTNRVEHSVVVRHDQGEGLFAVDAFSFAYLGQADIIPPGGGPTQNNQHVFTYFSPTAGVPKSGTRYAPYFGSSTKGPRVRRFVGQHGFKLDPTAGHYHVAFFEYGGFYDNDLVVLDLAKTFIVAVDGGLHSDNTDIYQTLVEGIGSDIFGSQILVSPWCTQADPTVYRTTLALTSCTTGPTGAVQGEWISLECHLENSSTDPMLDNTGEIDVLYGPGFKSVYGGGIALPVDSNKMAIIVSRDGSTYYNEWQLTEAGTSTTAQTATDEQIPGFPFLDPTQIDTGSHYLQWGVDSLESGAFYVRAPWNAPSDFIYKLSAYSSASTIGAIIEQICEDVGYTQSDFDVTALDAIVPGYALPDPSAPRQAIEQLAWIQPFDLIPQDGKLVGKLRSAEHVDCVIDSNDVGMRLPSAKAEGKYERNFVQPRDLPRSVTLTCADPSRTFQNSTAMSRRNVDVADGSTNEVNITLSANISPSQAKQICDDRLFNTWLDGQTVTFTLPMSYVFLDPADIVRLDDMILRITKIHNDGVILTLTCSPAYPTNYDPDLFPPADGGPEGPTLETTQGVQLWLMDIGPLTTSELSSNGLYVATTQVGGEGGSTPSTYVYRSPTGANDWKPWSSGGKRATWAVMVDGPIGYKPTENITDLATTLNIKSMYGEFESVGRADLWDGKNLAALGNPTDGWEIIQFQNAVLTGAAEDGRPTYTLSVFKRGLRGSEAQMTRHRATDVLILLEQGKTAFGQVPLAQVGASYDYIAPVVGQSVGGVGASTVLDQGNVLKPFAPCHLKAVRADDGSAITVSWKRRARLGEWNPHADVPLDQQTEAYVLRILDGGGAVIRTVNTSAPYFVYSATQETADFGGPQAAINIRVSQVSLQVGEGQTAQRSVAII